MRRGSSSTSTSPTQGPIRRDMDSLQHVSKWDAFHGRAITDLNRQTWSSTHLSASAYVLMASFDEFCKGQEIRKDLASAFTTTKLPLRLLMYRGQPDNELMTVWFPCPAVDIFRTNLTTFTRELIPIIIT